jgi:hypothetical protein
LVPYRNGEVMAEEEAYVRAACVPYMNGEVRAVDDAYGRTLAVPAVEVMAPVSARRFPYVSPEILMAVEEAKVSAAFVPYMNGEVRAEEEA